MVRRVSKKRQKELRKKIPQLQQGYGARPPKEWFDGMRKIIVKGYPGRNKYEWDRLVAGVWHKYPAETKISIIRRLARGSGGIPREENPQELANLNDPMGGHESPYITIKRFNNVQLIKERNRIIRHKNRSKLGPYMTELLDAVESEIKKRRIEQNPQDENIYAEAMKMVALSQRMRKEQLKKKRE